MRTGRYYLPEDQENHSHAPAEALDACRPPRSSGLLVQVFSSFADHDRLQDALREILRRHPQAVIIGASSDGEIVGRQMHERGALFMFAWCERCRVRAASAHEADSFATGRRLAETLISPEARAVIAFVNGLSDDGDAFLRGFDALNPRRVPLCGGLSADGDRFRRCRVLFGARWQDGGAVAAVFEGERLHVIQESLLSWHPVGRPLRVERAQGDRVMRIAGRSPAELYRDYLGEQIAAGLPRSALSFPLFMERDGLIVARTPISAPDDSGALRFAGEIPEGAYVRFGIVNSTLLKTDIDRLAARLRAASPEVLFAYSCMARKGYFADALESEFSALDNIAPLGGFFTYGELYGTPKARALLNGTTTLLGLAENPGAAPPPRPYVLRPPHASPVVEGMSHLIERVLEDLEAQEEENRRLQEYDALTGLPNRHLLAQRLEQASRRAAMQRTRILVLFIGIARFKDINDLQGHSAGDALLRQVAQRLAGLEREKDMVGRFGGDVFALVAESLHPAWSLRAAEVIIRRFLEAFDAPFDFNGASLRLRPHIGATLSGGDKSADQIFQQAELALFAAKAEPQTAFRFYDPEQQREVATRLDIENRLRRAMEEGRLRLALQPQVDRQGRLIGAEALMRISGDDPAWLRSAAFIPAAEQGGLITAFGRHALAQGAGILADWQRTPERRHLKLSVNISAEHFARADFAEEVADILARHGAEPRGLTLELTESVFAADKHAVRRTMASLRELGVGLSLDDFGTGYSSLAYLRDFPLNELKIDQSFVRALDHQAADADSRVIRLIQAIIEIGEALDMHVVAEGVESKAQWEALKALDCPSFQGWLFGRPALYPEEWPMPQPS